MWSRTSRLRHRLKYRLNCWLDLRIRQDRFMALFTVCMFLMMLTFAHTWIRCLFLFFGGAPWLMQWRHRWAKSGVRRRFVVAIFTVWALTFYLVYGSQNPDRPDATHTKGFIATLVVALLIRLLWPRRTEEVT